jgi:glutathione reductase (NADPH)
VNAQDTSSWYTTRRIGLKYSSYKILIDKKTDQIIGAHLFGHHAEEVINIFALAMQQKMTRKDLKEMIWSYPTSTYDINYML